MAYTVDLRKKKAEPELKPESVSAAPAKKEAPTSAPEPAKKEIKIPGVVSWTAPLRVIPKRRPALIIAVLLWLTGASAIFFLHDYLFATGLAIAGAVLILLSYQKLETASVSVESARIVVGDREFFYSQIKSFWVNYAPPRTAELIVTLRKPYLPVLRIPLGDADPLAIRKIMVSFVPETEHEDSVLDQIVKYLSI